MKAEKKCGSCKHWQPNGGVLGFGYCKANGWVYRRPEQGCKTKYEDKEE